MIRPRRDEIFFFPIFFIFLGMAFLNEASALTGDEKNNIAIYQKASPSVVNVISTVITHESAQRLELKAGGHACALIKASSVILGVS